MKKIIVTPVSNRLYFTDILIVTHGPESYIINKHSESDSWYLGDYILHLNPFTGFTTLTLKESFNIKELPKNLQVYLEDYKGYYLTNNFTQIRDSNMELIKQFKEIRLNFKTFKNYINKLPGII